ncbi:serpin family protein [Actinopolymorpha sp. B11F2]|uniref:serpin family protein n=1 Tax=Actinopolymorpha sp. B11F2 TaxID=3160862 RepID=UPI0032E3FD4B
MMQGVGTSRRAVLIGALAAPLLAACGREAGGANGGNGMGGKDGRGGLRLVAAAGVDRVTPPRDAPVAPTVDGMTAFGHALMQRASDPLTNFVASPASIAFAFGMVRAGARGETAVQIDDVLGFPPDGPHLALNAITRQVVTTDKAPPRASSKREPGEPPAPPVVAVANALFAQEGFAIREAFLRTLKEHYDTGVQTLDLQSPAALETINAWVRQQTAERITKLFEELNPDTMLVLANAVYLKADWAVPFEESATRDETFTKADGGTVKAPMMTRMGAFRHASGADWQAAELPYAGGELAMWIVVPTAKPTAAAPFEPVTLLRPQLLREVASGLRSGRARVALPRWDFATNLELASLLQLLGMTVPFGRSADFSGIADRLYIDQAIHRANITVDEFGTEAAAVTGLAMRTTSLPAEPKTVIRADRAFAFAVVHLPTQTPLFLGQVADPTATE